MERLNKEDMYIYEKINEDIYVKRNDVEFINIMTDKINEIIDYINRENESVDYAPLPPNLEEKNGIMDIIGSL